MSCRYVGLTRPPATGAGAGEQPASIAVATVTKAAAAVDQLHKLLSFFTDFGEDMAALRPVTHTRARANGGEVAGPMKHWRRAAATVPYRLICVTDNTVRARKGYKSLPRQTFSVKSATVSHPA